MHKCYGLSPWQGALHKYKSRASIALGVSGNWKMNASIKMLGLVMGPKGQMKPTMGGYKKKA